MAQHKQQLKRIAAPKTWPILKKVNKYISKPDPGAHSEEYSIPIAVVLREIIKFANTKKEVQNMLNAKKVLLDGKAVKRVSRGIGLMDVLSFPQIKKNYQVILNRKGKLSFEEINEKEAKEKQLKINGKTILSQGKTQLNFHDGRSIIVEKDEYKVGDSILLDLEQQKIKQHLKMEKGSNIILLRGKHIGTRGVIQNIISDRIIFKTEDKEEFETQKSYIFITRK